MIPDEITLEYTKCPLGCELNDELVVKGKDLLHNLPGIFSVVRCTSCGLMRTNPRPSQETIGFYYPDNYGPYLGTEIKKNFSPDVKLSLIKKIIKKLIDFKTKPLPYLSPRRMLEVGCGAGAFLHKMAAKGWEVSGIELSKKAAEAASNHGYNIYKGALETAPAPSQPCDLIVGWMVLEHLHDPIQGLKKLFHWARPGGYLVLSVPNAGALEFNLFKKRWYALQLPNHLYHFTPKTLRKTINASGWQAERIIHQRVLSNFVASTGYLLQDKGYANMAKALINFPVSSGIMQYAIYPLAFLLSLMGQTGRMTIWARKKND